MFSEMKHCQYEKNQLAEVICQLRFPEILTINTNQPAEFQEAIRSIFPLYSVRAEGAVPKISGTPSNLHLEQAPVTNNHQFLTEDSMWRVNLTSKFISLSCSHYTNWESFAACLDTPLAAFIKIYKPAFFERIGLRYMNFISRNNLGLTNFTFSEMFHPAYLGILGANGIDEQNVAQSGVDTDMTIQNGCHVKIHAGPGMVSRNGQTDSEVKFIFDQDLYMPGKIPVNYSAGALETLHAQAYPIFRSAITDLLHNAMEPDQA